VTACDARGLLYRRPAAAEPQGDDVIDRELLRNHRMEFSFLVGRFMVEHLARVHRAFDGDLATALVLGTIGQYNATRFFEGPAAASPEPADVLIARGEHLPHLRPCNAMSVASSTGIPRETVRRKIKWLVAQGWVEQVGRDKLYITRKASEHFAEFDHDTMERFAALMSSVSATAERRSRSKPAVAGGSPQGTQPT
jgi:DNA-binding transcriptional regulator YhcF (GntR family)